MTLVLNSPDVQPSWCPSLSNVPHEIGVCPKNRHALEEVVDADIDESLMFL